MTWGHININVSISIINTCLPLQLLSSKWDIAVLHQEHKTPSRVAKKPQKPLDQIGMITFPGMSMRCYFEVGGGGRSSNIPANASWSQLPESTRNLYKQSSKKIIHLKSSGARISVYCDTREIHTRSRTICKALIDRILATIILPHLGYILSSCSVLSFLLSSHPHLSVFPSLFRFFSHLRFFAFSNLANWSSSSGAVPSAKGVQSCSSK